jgi:hypothetical protein
MIYFQKLQSDTINTEYWMWKNVYSVFSLYHRCTTRNFVSVLFIKVKLSHNRPWRSTGLWDVEVPTMFIFTISSDNGEVVSLMCQPRYTPSETFIFSVFGTYFCYRLSKPQGLMRLEGLDKLKKSMISSGLNPATFGLIA